MMTFYRILLFSLSFLIFIAGCVLLARILYRKKIKGRQCPELSKSMKRFTLASRDGISLEGFLASSRSDQDHAVILAHGFADNKTNCQILKLTLALQENFDVYLFDFRGYGGSGGRSTMGIRESNDMLAVLDHVTTLGYEKISIIGNSIGGMVAIQIAAETAGLTSVITVSASAGFSDESPLRKLIIKLIFTTAPGRWLLQIISGIPLSEKTSQLLNTSICLSPQQQVALVSPVPILFLHGGDDKIVPVKNAHQLFEAAKDPKWIKVYPGGGHSITDLGQDFSDDFRQDISNWLLLQV